MKSLKLFAGTAGLCVLILVTCCFANQILNTNVRKYDSTATKEAAGSQVLFLGTSQGYNGINPLMIWDESGIESYNFCAPGQYIGTTYYVLKDIYNYQSPKVIVLDFESLTRPEDFLTISHKLYSLPMIAGLRNRFDMYQDIIGESPIYFIPMLRYHNRWKEISRKDFQKDYDLLGAGRRTTMQEGVETLPQPFAGNMEPIGERELAYLNQILLLTREHGSELILLDMPSYSSEAMEAVTEGVRQWAADNQITVCEANRQPAFDAMELCATDFADEFHLNVWGQQKLSVYLGQWLLENTSAANDRQSENGRQWEARMPAYRSLANDGRLLMESDMAEYFRLLKQGNYTVVISLSGDYKSAPEALWPVLEEYGITYEEYETGGVFVKNPQGDWLFKSRGSTSFLWDMALGADDLVLRGTGVTDELGRRLPKVELLFERSDQSLCSDGINVLVYNHSIKAKMECVGFDANNGYQMCR